MAYIEEAHVNDIGTIFSVTVYDTGSTGTTSVLDVSGATTKQIIFKKPTGTTLTKAAVFTTDGTDGKIQYVTVSDDLDSTGTWQLQAYIVASDGSWKSDVGTFKVYENL